MTRRVIDVEKTGKNLGKICQAKGITASDLMRLLGFNSPTAVYKWFRGEGIPSTDNLVIISDFLEVGLEDIIVKIEPGCED